MNRIIKSKDYHSNVFFRLRTHITILEQQQNSNGYFSYEETPSLNEHTTEVFWI